MVVHHMSKFCNFKFVSTRTEKRDNFWREMSGSVWGSSDNDISSSNSSGDILVITTDHTNSSICYELEFDSTTFKAVAAIRTTVGLFSFLCSATVILLIVVYKKYNCLPQRLILYLAIATMLHSVAYILGRVHYGEGHRKIDDPYCLFSGTFELYASWVELMAITNINTHIFALFLLKRQSSKFDIVVHIAVCYFLPALWCWIPFLHDAFGSAGPWCGIRIYEADCEYFLFGNLLRIFLWHAPLYTIFLVIFITLPIVFTVRLKKEITKWEGVYNPNAIIEKKKMLSILKPILWYPLIFMILKLPYLISTIYDSLRTATPVYAIWFIQAFTSPLAGAVLALLYAVDSDTLRRIRRMSKKPYYILRKRLSKKQDNCKTCSGEIEVYGLDMYTMYGDSLEGEAYRRVMQQRAQALRSHANTLTNV